MRVHNNMRYRGISVLASLALVLAGATCISAQEPLDGFDLQILKWAEQCREEVVGEFQKLLDTNQLSIGQIFDTFYIPIPGTYPQKYHTQYDKYTEDVLRIILDKYLEQDTRIQFVVAVDRNGYLPTHNSRYSRPLTGDQDQDTKNNRSKRIFNDRTGLAAARSTSPYLLQKYSRDTGETMADLSVPIFLKDKHWGAIRFGYKR